jgi:hypothetical protein
VSQRPTSFESGEPLYTVELAHWKALDILGGRLKSYAGRRDLVEAEGAVVAALSTLAMLHGLAARGRHGDAQLKAMALRPQECLAALERFRDAHPESELVQTLTPPEEGPGADRQL